ncbi:MAG TPA: hypothetical protein VGF34_17145 [Stellaceae bacterium]
MVIGDKGIRDGVIVAAGAAQPDAVPSVEYLAGAGGQHHHARNRGSVGSETRPIAVDNPAVTDEPGTMLTAAGKRPSADDPITARLDHGLPEWRKRSTQDCERITAKNLLCSGQRQITAKYTQGTADQ